MRTGQAMASGLAPPHPIPLHVASTLAGVVGKDPVALLSAALEAAGQPCHIAALLNDTVGVMAAHRWVLRCPDPKAAGPTLPF